MSTLQENQIVISGISGRFPECDNIDDFKEKLLQGVDMVTLDDDRRWPAGIYGLPKRSGKLKDIKHFDATFFGVHSKQANVMDPQLKLFLEVTYEAIIDAGFNPVELKGSKTGVYVGSCLAESLDYWTRTEEVSTGYLITGCNRSMFANRISYCFDFIGPSIAIDTGCSSSMVALQEACDAIKHGKCDSAIVAGLSINLNPHIAKHFNSLKMLSFDGKCKSFDASGDGYVRSETVAAIFIQKSNHARRVYATILNAKSNNDGYKKESITHPSSKMQSKIIKEVYSECDIDPTVVDYVETHGTGTKVGDPQELNAIVEVFCTESRKSPLMIGSVKSNMGHAEPASGICSLVKVIISMECGILPKNLHYNTPNPHIPGLNNGQLKVLSENQLWGGGYVGVNCFGFGGVNVHVALHYNPKQKLHFTKISIPRLITVSGRTKESVEYFINQIKTKPYDEELYALVNRIHENNINGHNYRGFILLEENTLTIEHVTKEKRPIWYVFSGMGCQWSGMGRELMYFEPFKKSIERSSNTLAPKGINLLEIINAGHDLTNDLRKSFISVTAIQIALVDVLKTLSVEPDGIIGHSIGEISCGYADGALTHEEAILASLARADAVLENDLPRGAMACVGITPEEFRKRNPQDIYIACYNSKDNLTISGPPDLIEKFTNELKKDGFFTKGVDVFGYAFHSRYIAGAESTFTNSLIGVIQNPKQRSKRWISSSILEHDWDGTLAQNASIDYYANNLVSPVYFHQACMHIHQNAIVIEIAPHAILQTILKRSLAKSVINIGLMTKTQSDVKYLLSNIGRIYNSGGQPKISALYPVIEYPVSRGTPVISSMVKWDHSVEWAVPNFCSKPARFGELVVAIDMNKKEFAFLREHVIGGENILPESALIVFLWQVFGKLQNKYFQELPVIIRNIKFIRKIILSNQHSTNIVINIFEGSGKFEISHENEIVATGTIKTVHNIAQHFLTATEEENTDGEDLFGYPVVPLNNNDIYKDLNLKGYSYENSFKGIISSNNNCSKGIICWQTNWITFISQIIQYTILEKEMRELCIVSEIEKLVIDPNNLLNEHVNKIPVNYNKTTGVITASGVQLKGIRLMRNSKSITDQLKPTLQKYEFVALVNTKVSKKLQIITVIVQLIIENNVNETLNVVEILADHNLKPSLNTMVEIRDAIENEPRLYFNGFVVDSKAEVKSNFDSIRIVQKYSEANAHLVILKCALTNEDDIIITHALSTLNVNGFILFEERNKFYKYDLLKKYSLKVVLQQETAECVYILAKKKALMSNNPFIIKITEDNYDWVEPLKEAMLACENTQNKIYLISQGCEPTGLIGMVKCLIQEPGGANIRCFYVEEGIAERFSLDSNFYINQLERDLVQNVFKNSTWGTFKHLELDNVLKKEIHESSVDARTLQWIEKPVKCIKERGVELCSVYYVGLNISDVMISKGIYSEYDCSLENHDGGSSLGMEFTGLNANGERVMGLVKGGALATSVHAESTFLWDVPKMWTLEEAVSVPMAYIMSYIALIQKARIQPNHSILIHAGLSATSQAALHIATQMGCNVFTTVANNSEKKAIMKLFPKLKLENVSNYEDLTFEQIIKKETNRQGVDIILNYYEVGEIGATIRCLAQNGKLLQVGYANDQHDYATAFSKGISVHFIIIDSIHSISSYEKENIHNWLKENLKNGKIHPLTKTTLSCEKLEKAFDLITSKETTGKVILQIRNTNSSAIIKSSSVLRRTYFNPDKVYLVIGGLGGFGLELIKWLVLRHAKKIVICSRKGIITGYQSLCLRKLKQQNIKILISKVELTTEEGVKELLEESNKLGTIAGVFNLALVLNDGLMVNLSKAHFENVCGPKARVAKYFDKYTRIFAKDLDYFVMFSSVSCGRGNPGQANYGYANSAMERICEERKIHGLPALAIQWGPIAQTGIIARSNPNIHEHRGTLLQKISSCLATLDILLNQTNAVVSSFVLAEKKICEVEEFADVVASILGLKNYHSVSESVTLAELGMDSLMAAEIEKVLKGKFGLVICHKTIQDLTFKTLNLLTKQNICGV